MQQELRLIGVLDSEPRLLDWSLIKHCATEQAAMRLCKSKSYAHYTDDDIADALGMNRASLNTILNSDGPKGRPRYMPRTLQVKMQKFCGNRAIDQWAEMYEKGLLQCQKSDKEQKREALQQEYERLLKELG